MFCRLAGLNLPPLRCMSAATSATMGGTHKPLNTLFNNMPTTIFEVMSKLATQHNSVNLGQGFPDDALEGPASMKDIVGRYVQENSNQYPSLMGLPSLRQALARHNKRYYDLDVDWQSEVVITVGATEALTAALMGLLNEGDEIVVFDPQYDSYASICQRVNVTVNSVPLEMTTEGLTFDRQRLAAAFSPRTKLILLNTPHNPTGKVFTRDELDYIAKLMIQYNTYAILDEVYEHLVFDGYTHVSLRQLPGMQDRCIRIGSAGKTFSFTAWKIGWATGPAHLINAVAKAHQFLVFTVPSNLQAAVAHGLDHEASFYTSMGAQLEKKRGFLEQRLRGIGFEVLPAQGTYFLVADIRPLLELQGRQHETDVDFCHRMTTEAGVTLIPVSAFYVNKDNAPTHLVRFCFCKNDDKLEKACNLLEQYFASLPK